MSFKNNLYEKEFFLEIPDSLFSVILCVASVLKKGLLTTELRRGIHRVFFAPSISIKFLTKRHLSIKNIELGI